MIILIVDNGMMKSFICICERIDVGSIGVLKDMTYKTFLVGFLPLILLVEFLIVVQQNLLV